MTDISKALEAARSNACLWMQCSDECLKSPDCKKAARAAVLAFLRAMPDAKWPKHVFAEPWTPSRLAAAVEKETQG